MNTKLVVEKTPVSFANKSKICGKMLTIRNANARINHKIESSSATCDFRIFRVIKKIVATATRINITRIAIDKPELILPLPLPKKLHKQN